MAGGCDDTARPLLKRDSLAFSRATIAGALCSAPERSSRGLRPKKNKPWSGLLPLKPAPLMMPAAVMSSSSRSTAAICWPTFWVCEREAPFCS